MRASAGSVMHNFKKRFRSSASPCASGISVALRFPRVQDRVPLRRQPAEVLGMHRGLPSPAKPFLGGQTRVVVPPPIQEFVPAARPGAPRKRGNRVDDLVAGIHDSGRNANRIIMDPPGWRVTRRDEPGHPFRENRWQNPPDETRVVGVRALAADPGPHEFLMTARSTSSRIGGGTLSGVPASREHFTPLVPSQRRKRTVIVPMQAFIDDSGGNGQGRCLSWPGSSAT